MNYITIHCSASQCNMDTTAESMRIYHKEVLGWSDIGYHFVIEADGNIQPGRDVNRRGAHVKDHNTGNIGICMVGGIEPDGSTANNFNAQQWQALKSLVQTLQHTYSIPSANVKGHRDWFGDTNGDGVIDSRDWLKECPCFDVKSWLLTLPQTS